MGVLVWLLLLATTVQAQNSCSICQEGQVVTNGDFVLPENTAGFLPPGLTCDEVEALALAGEYSLGQCLLLNYGGVRITWYV